MRSKFGEIINLLMDMALRLSQKILKQISSDCSTEWNPIQHLDAPIKHLLSVLERYSLSIIFNCIYNAE